MFNKSIVNSSKFLKMPISSRLLYYDLGMNADDDGYAEHFMVMRMTGASQQDLGVLQLNGFITVFDENVLIITDWKENNYIQKDRYTPSKYIGVYDLDTICIQDVDTGKVRLGKVREGKGIDIDAPQAEPSTTTVVEIPTQSNHNGSSGNPEQPRATQPQHDTDTDLDLDTELELEPVTENQKPCPSQNSMGERFEQFWKAYPKKKSKGDAEKAFKTIKPDGELLERILSAIESQKLTEQWQRDGGQFIPYPATWLRAKDWENEEFEEFEVEYAETLHYPEERPKIGGGMTWQDLDI